MQRGKTAAAIALLVVLCSSVPSYAAPRERKGPGDEGPIDRIIQLIEKMTHPIVHVLEELTIPKP